MELLSVIAAVAAGCLMIGSAVYALLNLSSKRRARSGAHALRVLSICWSVAAVLVAVAIGSRVLAG
jgi:hypothetical protein